MLGRIGTTELLLILGIALLIFGPSKLPKLGKDLEEFSLETVRMFEEDGRKLGFSIVC